MSPSPEALAIGSRLHFIPASLSLPLSGAFLTGLATAVGPASRRGFRAGAMLTLLRLPLSPACAFASARFRQSSVGERNLKLDPTRTIAPEPAPFCARRSPGTSLSDDR